MGGGNELQHSGCRKSECLLRNDGIGKHTLGVRSAVDLQGSRGNTGRTAAHSEPSRIRQCGCLLSVQNGATSLLHSLDKQLTTLDAPKQIMDGCIQLRQNPNTERKLSRRDVPAYQTKTHQKPLPPKGVEHDKSNLPSIAFVRRFDRKQKTKRPGEQWRKPACFLAKQLGAR